MLRDISILITLFFSIGAIIFSVANKFNDMKHIKDDIKILWEKLTETRKDVTEIKEDVAYIKGKMNNK